MTLKNTFFTYNSSYRVTIDPSLIPKYGTEPLSKQVQSVLTTSDFYTLSALQNISSSTGEIIDTEYFGTLSDTSSITLPFD